MNDKEKQKLLRDDEGNFILIVKPILERSCRYNMFDSFQNNELYKLLLSIENNMSRVLHYKNTFLHTL